MPISAIERARLEKQFADSDVEYWKIDADETMKMVFRNEEVCRECFQKKHCFVLRKNDKAMCMDCDARIEPEIVEPARV